MRSLKVAKPQTKAPHRPQRGGPFAPKSASFTGASSGRLGAKGRSVIARGSFVRFCAWEAASTVAVEQRA